MKGVFANARRVFDALGRKVTPYEAGKELAPGITVGRDPRPYARPHSHIVASGNGKVYVQADVTNIRRCSCAIRAGTRSSTRTAKMAEATRRKVYDMLVAEKMLVQGFHYPFPSLAYVEKSGIGLSRDSGALESGALNVPTGCDGRPPERVAFLFFARRRPRDALISRSTASPHQEGRPKAATREELMIELTRRRLLSGATMATAAAGLAPFAPSPASAAAPPAGKQAPGWYRYKVGTIEVTVVTDGARAFPLSDTFVRNVPKDEVNKALEAGLHGEGQCLRCRIRRSR